MIKGIDFIKGRVNNKSKLGLASQLLTTREHQGGHGDGEGGRHHIPRREGDPPKMAQGHLSFIFGNTRRSRGSV